MGIVRIRNAKRKDLPRKSAVPASNGSPSPDRKHVRPRFKSLFSSHVVRWTIIFGVLIYYNVVLFVTTSRDHQSSYVAGGRGGNDDDNGGRDAAVNGDRDGDDKGDGDGDNFDQRLFRGQLLPFCSLSRSYPRDKHPSSDADSIFNCNHTDAERQSLCRYYYPAEFFDADCGVGRAFRYMIDELEAKRKNLTLWKNMPHIGFLTLSLNNVCIFNETMEVKIFKRLTPRTKDKDYLYKNLTGSPTSFLGQTHHPEEHKRCLKERITTLHVHKAGGSSLFETFMSVSRSNPKNSTLDRYKHHWGTMTSVAINRTEARSSNALSHATRYPSSRSDSAFASEQTVVFATVRDPIERFVSSVGQAVGGGGSQKNKVGKIIMRSCRLGKDFEDPDERRRPNATTALRCVADYVANHTFWCELHFTPMALDMAFGTLWTHLPVAVFHMDRLPDVLRYLGRGNVHARNSKKGKYRAVDVLRNATADDMDDHTLELVCRMYEVDVLMMRSLGYETPRCDKWLGTAGNWTRSLSRNRSWATERA